MNLRAEFLESRHLMAGDYNPAAGFEIQAQLDIYLNGTLQALPVNFGKSTGADSNTITSTGSANPNRVNVKYTAGQRTTEVTVAEIFDRLKRDTVVGNPNAVFTSSTIMGSTTDASHTIRFYVNGELNTDFQIYQFKDEDQLVISYEPITTADAPTFLPIQNLTVLAGSPLYIPLNGYDPANQNLTFTATSSNSSVSTYIPQDNPYWKVDVAGYGEMLFQLFADKADRPVDRITTLTNQDFYDGIIFHRVINNFVIQGGDPTGTGSGGSTLPDFNDQFHVDLQHNRTGLLSYAKTTDDTNDSQFFITEGSSRHLDFNHSIFGMLVEGENVRALISDVAVGAGDRPLTNVTIASASIVTSPQNNVMMLKAPNGFTGTSDITVTVSDTDGKTFQQTFRVTVVPDSVNTPAFLDDIPPITIPRNETSNFTLTSKDVEGDAVTYALEKVGSVTNYTATVNPSTGVVTITPPPDFTGTLQLRATLTSANNTTAGQSDIQTFNVTVNAGTTRTLTIDLNSVSDTGISNTDNITKATNLQIDVGGVQSGDIIRLYDGTTLVEQQTATGATLSFTVSNATEGVHAYQAKFVANGTETSTSSVLNVTVDRTPAGEFTTRAPSQAVATELFTYNVQHSQEGTGDIAYSIADKPTGMEINASTGLITWTPSTAGTFTFTITAMDVAGNFDEQEVTLTVNPFATAIIETQMEIVDASGNVLESLVDGQAFFLRVLGRDLRATPALLNLFGFDISYDSNKAQTTGTVTIASGFLSLVVPTLTPGLMTSVSGVAINPEGTAGDFQELFRIPMKATGSGPILFEATHMEGDGGFATSGTPARIDPAALRFPNLTINVSAAIAAVNDEFSVPEDSVNFSLNVLGNDTKVNASDVLTIKSVGSSAQGATISIATDGKTLLYSPALNFVGQDTFTYTIQNQNGSESTATVTIQTTGVNDPPVAVNDSFNAQENTEINLDVLANDNSGPDLNETLTISAVTQGNRGGTITIINNGQQIRYKPAAGVVGTETFTYTIRDPGGLTSTATVTMNINDTNDNPVAVDDAPSVAEDSTTVELNVLANDNSGPDTGETLTINSVGTPNQGGTVTISADKTKLIYTPKPNFFGVDTFTYTITDGNGGTATATVRVNVTNTNDAPSAVADSASVNKNSASNAIDVLKNDTSAPDPVEELTISAVGTPTRGGTVTISADGKSINYKPAADFVGTETFTYTIRDPGGLTSTASVTVDVKDFSPSSIKGHVYIDGNRNGRRDLGEMPLANVLVTLTGKDVNGQSVNTTVRTANDGSYVFANLVPGDYKVKESQPAFLIDGAEQTGSHGATSVLNDEFNLTLPENVDAINYNFGELGTQVQFIRTLDLFAKRPRDIFLAAVGTGTTSNWTQALGNGWQQYTSQSVTLNSAGTQLDIKVTDAANNVYMTTVGVKDPRVQTVGKSGSMFYFQLAPPSQFTFTQQGSSSTPNVAPQVTTSTGTTAYTEGDTTAIDPGILVSDADSATLTGATVAITTNFASGEDVLVFDNQAGITGSYSATTGILTLTGTASKEVYQTALRTVRYRNTSNSPSIAGRTITFRVTDGGSTNSQSNAATKLVSITAVNDPPKVTTTAGETAYSTGGAGVIVDSALTVTDPDGDTIIKSASVKITAGLQSTDVLNFTAQSGITGSYIAATGELVFTGNAPLATYQALLRSVTYSNSNTSSPSTANRTISFTVTDAADAASPAATRTIKYSAPNTFTVSEGAAIGTSVGTVSPSSSTTGATIYEFDQPAVDNRLDLNFDDHLDGNPAAPLVLIEYLDYQCSVCKTYLDDLEALKTEFGDQLLIVRRHAPINSVHANAEEAAWGAEAAHKQGKFNEYSAKLFDKQDEWKDLTGEELVEALEFYAVETGLNLLTFRTDYASTAVRDRVARDLADLTALNNNAGNSVPAFFLNGTRLNNAELNSTPANFIAAANTALAAVTSPVQINRTTGQITVTKPSAFNASTTPTITRTVNVTDSSGTQAVTVTINVTAVNAAPVVTPTAGSAIYNAGAEAVNVDAGVTVTDANSTSLTGATVSITAGLNPEHDFLEFNSQNGITGSYNSTTGVLTLSGSATVAQYQTALQSIKFRTDSLSGTASTRTITYVVNDGGTVNSTSTPVTRGISVRASNTFTVNESAAVGTIVGQIQSLETLNGTKIIYEINAPAVDDILDLNIDDHLDGNPAAPVVLIEYLDYQCPICAGFQDDLAALKAQFGDQLLIVRRHLPLTAPHPNAAFASWAAEAAGKQGKFDEYGSKLFELQTEWSNLTGQALVNEFQSYASDLGLNTTTWLADYNSPAVQARVQRDLTDLTTLNNGAGNSAPTFFLNGERLNNNTLASVPANFISAVQAKLNAVTSPVQVNRLTGQIVVTNPALFNATATPVITLTVNITDSDNTHAETVIINVTEGDAAAQINTSTGTTSYTENGSPTAVDPALSIVYNDGTNLASATVSISGFVAGQEALQFANQNGISGSFNATTGVLSLTGVATVAQYQVALRSVTYTNSHQDPASSRTINFVVNDGVRSSVVAAKAILITGVNDSPVFSMSTAALEYVENGEPIQIADDALVTDVDSVNLEGAVVSFSAGFVPGEDELLYATIHSITGVFNPTTGQLSLSGSANLNRYQQAIRTITYRNTSENPSTAPRTISIVLNDGSSANGNSAIVSRPLNVTAVNDAPAFAVPSAQTTSENTSLVFDATKAISLSDLDAGDGDLEVTITVTNGTIDLGSLADLEFIGSGDGTGDTTVTFRGTLSAIGAALTGLTFNPETDYIGAALLQLAANDLGNTGGPAASDLETIAITVESAGSGESPALDSFFAELASDDGSDDSWSSDDVFEELGA